ncbi:MAG: PBP1A family penicillin-binding protein [Rhizomicrobium sp.]|jgi:penicillin-binding protein 1A
MLGEYLLDHLHAFQFWLSRHSSGIVRIATIGLACVAAILTLLYFTPTILSWFAPKLDLSKDLYSVNRPVAFTFVDAAGDVVGHRGAIVGDRLKLDEMPAYLPAAFIAMEDRRFYENQGIDIRGMVRAFWTNFRAGHVVQGGSTITEQTAKIVFLNPKRTYSRRLTELFDAAALAKSLSKQQILEVYLNRIYLGAGAYGVDGAAHVYFGKSARALTLSEAAMLATLTAAPSAYSPRRDLEAAQNRADIVLKTMVETGAITAQQAKAASDQPAEISDNVTADARNFFLDTAADEALKDVDENGDTPPTSDLVVHTTLVPRLQDAARRAVAKTLGARGAKLHASQAAVVLMKPDGAVAALIGGRDYDSSSYNRATQARRQPGSAFKPFVYLAAIESGMTPWDERDDAPVDIDGWTPTNYGGRSYGTVTLASALAHSINTVTAGLAQEVGVTTVVDAAHRCGIVSQLVPNASLALGTSEVTPLELTTAYGTFASGGTRIWPYFVTEVDDSAHRVLWQRKPPPDERVVASHVDRDLTTMLAGVVTEGTGRSAALSGHEAAGKTGTTQDYHDAWFVGYTTDYIAGVWVGNDDSSPMKSVTGGTLPAQIWKQVMMAAEQGLPPKPLAKSAEPAATDEAPTEDATTGDDESSGGGTGTPAMADSAPDETQQPQQPDNSEAHGSFWNWMFGNHRQQQPPLHQPPPSAENQPLPQDQADPPDTQEQPQSDQDDTDTNGTNTPPPAQPPHLRRPAFQPPPPPPGNPPPPPPGADDPGH